jgi:uncharacterized BrkB/YihY/UPF0761 family membrane protein
MYRFLPNAKVEWSDVWVRVAVTSFLFYLGKLGLALYLGKGRSAPLTGGRIDSGTSVVGLLFRVDFLLRRRVHENLC